MNTVLSRIILNSKGSIPVWIPTNLYLGSLILVTSGQVSFWCAPIISLWQNTFFAYNVWTRFARGLKMAPIWLSHHSESNDMPHDLLWPDLTSDFRSNFYLDFWRTNYIPIIRSVLTRGTQWCQNLCSRLHRSEVGGKNVCIKSWCLTSVNFDL